MQIHDLPSGPIQTVGYLLLEPRTRAAVLVDAPAGIIEKITPLLARHGCQLRELWLTHGHWDHTQAAAQVRREFGVRVLAHPADRALIETPEIMEGFMGQKLGLEGVQVDRWIEHGERLEALGRAFEVRHVPGHCPGNVLFHEATDRIAFVGDALFNRGVGRWDLPGGDFDTLARSIREQIYTLPEDTVICPGHGPRTTVGAEKADNPYIAALAGGEP